MRRRSGQDRGTCVEPGWRSAFLPSAAALALYLLAAVPLALLPPPSAWAGISEGPDATCRICWGRARRSRGCVQTFSITPCSRDGRPSPKVLVCFADFFFKGSPNTHKNDGCALCFPALFLSARSRWPVPKPLAQAPPALAWGSLRCLGMLQLGAADGNSILNGSDDAVRASKLFAPAPVPKSHLLVLCGSAAVGANAHLCHPARSPSPRGQVSGQTPGILLQESSGPRCGGCCAQGCTPKSAVHGKRTRVLWQGWGNAWHDAECPAML